MVPARISPEEDARLLEYLEHGESGIGAEVYDRLLPVVDAALFRILGRREVDYPDLVQSVFEQIVATLSRKKFARRCSLVGWASVIACHVGLNALRARRRERKVLERSTAVDIDRPPMSPSLEGQVCARSDLAAVRACLSEMDEERGTALLLHAMGHDLTEIAALTGISLAAAQSRLSRGRRELREHMAREHTEGGDHGR
jgi:RNA polymerase sigma-70 factor (ECF subfamily)